VDGVLAIDKPAGMTSHDVVDSVRKTLGTRKVGHGGTLDPDATGVLVVGVGKATRFLFFAQSSPKRYVARIRFGTTTTTQDASGEVIETRPVELTQEQVFTELKRFVGPIEQIPPMVSAVRVGGERLHEMARRGEDVERPARPVTIYELTPIAFELGEISELEIEVRCSAGTYIRTLAHDIGGSLGCGAHLRTLRRTEAGGFTLADTIELDAVGPDRLMPISSVVGHLASTTVGEEGAALVKDGRPLPAPTELPDGEPSAVLLNGELLAVYRRKGDRLLAERVVPR
jgi:tRNA pseudouridine55 synthase